MDSTIRENNRNMTQDNPTIEVGLSLVLCTYGRTNEVDNFLDSIYRQTKKPTEIIIVDQNEENILHCIIKSEAKSPR